MKIKLEIGTGPEARITVTLPGHTWITGDSVEIEGYEPKWINHIGTERTEIIYRPAGSSITPPVVEVVPQSIAARHEEIYGEDDDDRAYERSLDS